jgi:hypothetical protein
MSDLLPCLRSVTNMSNGLRHLKRCVTHELRSDCRTTVGYCISRLHARCLCGACIQALRFSVTAQPHACTMLVQLLCLLRYNLAHVGQPAGAPGGVPALQRFHCSGSQWYSLDVAGRPTIFACWWEVWTAAAHSYCAVCQTPGIRGARQSLTGLTAGRGQHSRIAWSCPNQSLPAASLRKRIGRGAQTPFLPRPADQGQVAEKDIAGCELGASARLQDHIA